MKLSVHLMVLNGATVVGRLLRPLRGIADEICAVDTGSTDGTPEVLAEVAREIGAEIACRRICPETHPCLYFRDIPESYSLDVVSYSERMLLGDWSAARNLGLERCRGDYVLKLDADDEVVDPPHVLGTVIFLDQNPHLDLVMAPYEICNPATGEVERVEMYTRLWRNRPEIRFREACHENVDWCRGASAADPTVPNWTMAAQGLLFRDRRDSPGLGARVPLRNLKVLLREYDRILAAGGRPTAHLVAYLAQEAVGIHPCFSLEILDRWLSGLDLLPEDLAWTNFVRGDACESLGQVEEARRHYAAAAGLGFRRAALREAMLLFGQDVPGSRVVLEAAVAANRSGYYPVAAPQAELRLAETILRKTI